MTLDREGTVEELLELLPDGVVVADHERRIIYASRQAGRMFGYTDGELLGQAVEVLMPKRFNTQHIREWKRYISHPQKRRMGATGRDLWGKRKDGSEFPVDIALAPMETRTGVLILAVIRDMTARRKVESALREQRERMSAIAETARDAIVGADRQGCVTYWNPAAETMFGYTAGEITGQPLTVILPERFRDVHAAVVRRLLTMGQSRVIERILTLEGLRKDGTEFPLELSLASWTRDGEVMFAAILRDMTERRGIEQRMNTLASFSEHNPNPVLGVAPDGSTTYVNAAAREHFPDLEHLGLHHPILAGITDLLVTLRGEGTRSHVREVTIGGRVYDENIVLEETLDSAWLYLLDLTERKRGEQQLREAHERLSMSHERLKTTQMQLVEAAKLQSVGALAAGIAHEVKNPLMTIQMAVWYLSKHVQSDDHNVGIALKDMSEAVHRADAIIRGLLDFSAQRDVTLKDEALNKIVERALELTKHGLMKSHITVVRELAPDLPSLRLDPQKIEQVFLNLFMNAIQAMLDGGQLTVRTCVTQLTGPGGVVGSRHTDRLSVGETVVFAEVDDTGGGIPEDRVAKIFDPFYSTKSSGQGSGLGLAVTKSLVELHGGTIEIRNRKEGGVKAAVMFPIRREATSEGGLTKVKKRILVIDDEPSVTRGLKMNLEITGAYEVREEHTGIRALAAAREFRPNLILLDVMMPGKDGGDVAAELKDDELLKQTPIVFLSAVATREEAAAQGSIVGGQPFLAKPVDVKEVIRCIQRHVGT